MESTINQQEPEERLFFDPIKEAREEYYIEYRPNPSDGHATLSLTFLHDNQDPNYVRSLMAKEMRIWLKKYPDLQVVVHAFDSSDSNLNLGDLFENSLSGWIDKETNATRYTWKLYKTPDAVNTKSNAEWIKIFNGITYRTQTQIREQTDKHLKERILGLKIFRYVYFLWLGVIPLLWGLAQFFGPKTVGYIAMVYCLWKFVVNLNKVLFPGNWKDEPAESEKKRLKDHYFYHCELNPEGFAKLRSENFEKEQKQKTQEQYKNMRNA